MGTLKAAKKTAKIHELKEQAAVELWTQQQYAAPYKQTSYYSTSPQNEAPEAALHYIQTVQVNSLNKQEDNRLIQLLWLTTQLDAQVHQIDYEVYSGAECNIMPQYIYRLLFGDEKPEPPTIFINGYGGSPAKIKGHTQLYSSQGVRHHRKQYIQGHRHKRISHFLL